MWNDAVGWLIALLGLAVSANWLTSRTSRSLRRIRGEVEVLNLLPKGDAKTRLARHVERGVAEYVAQRRPASSWWMYPPMAMVRAVQGVSLAIAVGALVSAVLDDESGLNWWQLTAYAGGLAVGTAVGLWALATRIIRIRRRRVRVTGQANRGRVDRRQ